MIILGADHAGFELKEKIKKKLIQSKYSINDVSLNYDKEDDYTDIVENMCEKITDKDFGIMVCGTGIGSCIMANKFNGIRAAICFDEYTAKMTRMHNDANLLCLGGRTAVADDNKIWWNIVDKFITTEFSNEERHIRRINKIKEIEKRGDV